MLDSDMLESRSGTIKIANVSYETLQAFVDYLYTAETCLDDQMAGELLALGEKYQVKNLKPYCEKFFISNLNWDKSLKLFAFANKHNCEQLRSASLDVIMNHMPDLTQNDYYDELVQNNPLLLLEIYEKSMFKGIATIDNF
ncbi:hypothetical protein RJT34_22387 [Clitoria ternatea]|uniref:BTB domain-containing protein n=1 Tax=Clitoria ternatea TaxID=43366 RepID=A0AAN9IV86_CLITE